MDIQITRARSSHSEELFTCMSALVEELHLLPSSRVLCDGWVRAHVRRSESSNAPLFVAVEGSAVVGYCEITPSIVPGNEHCGTVALGIIESHRGRGIGRRLLAACMKHAKSVGMTRIQLDARADNAVAIALYEKMGFEHEGRRRKASCVKGVFYDEVHMSVIYDDPPASGLASIASPSNVEFSGAACEGLRANT